jgi:hypothetical protein
MWIMWKIRLAVLSKEFPRVTRPLLRNFSLGCLLFTFILIFYLLLSMTTPEIPTFKLVLGKPSSSAHLISLTVERPNFAILVLSRDRSMIQHYSPHNTHVLFITGCVTRSWRWGNRKNYICQGIAALQPFTLCPRPSPDCPSLFQRHLTGEFEKKYIGMYCSFWRVQAFLSRRVCFSCCLRSAPPHSHTRS